MSNTNASSRGRDGVTDPSAATVGTGPAHAAPETSSGRAARYVAGALRIALGWIFLWAFLDKLFGLGFATEREASWLEGGSPTEGYLSFATKGPFADTFQSLAGYAIVDWLFMLGLAGVGIALMVGAGVRLAAVAGSVMLLLMWLAALWPENNPFLDDHLIYIGVLALLALLNAGRTLGIGTWWESLPLVQRNRWLV